MDGYDKRTRRRRIRRNSSRKTAKPKPDVVRHDFRQTGWGHNIETIGTFTGGICTVATWSTPRVQVGDEIVYRVRLGVNVVVVIESVGVNSVDDMAVSRVKIIERIPSP